MPKRKPSMSGLEPVRRETLSPADFQKLLQESPDLIARSRFILPTVGKRGFGSFDVQYTIPRLRNFN